MAPNASPDLIVSRIIKAPPSAVWAAWKDPALLAKWWAPAPNATVVTKHEFYAGGAFGTVIRLQDGTEHSGEGCFLEVIENKRIVFTDALRGGWRPNEESFFSAIITLEAAAEGTKYTAVALHKNAEDRQKHLEMGFVDGWGTSIRQLEELAEQLDERGGATI